ARDFQRALFGTVLPRLGYRPFQLAFRVLLALAWGGYAVAIAAGLRGGLLPARWVLAGAATVGVASALFCPPSLSHDCYFYVGYARMALVYGLNPYAHTQDQLIARHDPFAPWLGPSGYGPIWTLLSMGLFALARGDAAWAQPAMMKLLEAGALILAALAGR